jgi:hypothetical protein
MDEKILARIRRRLTLDQTFMDDCAAFDAMDGMSWDLPAGMATHEWVRKRVSTEAHDILKTAVNLFDTHNPKWEILPRGPADADKAEELERWLEWQMIVASRNGDKDASTEKLRHAAKYGRICSQLDFLPYWCKEGTEEYKDALANPFCDTVHPAANIHYERGKYGLRWVANVSNIAAADAIDHWDAYQTDKTYGDKIRGAIGKINELLEDDEEARLMYVDYTDKEKRWVFAYLTNGESVDTYLEVNAEDMIEIVDGENKLGFINWAISEAASTPILYSLHHGGLWENQNFLDTIADSVIIRRGFFPLIKHKSMGGKPLEVDYTGAEAVMELDSAAGEEAEVMSPPPLDPGIRELMDRNSQKAASATGLKGLQNMNIVGNVQYASVNAMIQVSKSTLDPYLTAYQRNAMETARLAFMWVRKAGVTVTGYRQKDKNRDKNKVKGEKINVAPSDFDPKSMVIKCELLSTNTSDEMQRMNVFSQAKQLNLPISSADIVERMGWGEADVLKADWQKEQIEMNAMQIFMKMQDPEFKMKMMQFQQQMQAMQQQQEQMAQQQQAMQGGPPPGAPGSTPPPEQMGGAQMMPGGIGNDPNQGGLPPAMSDPNETRTQTQRPGP